MSPIFPTMRTRDLPNTIFILIWRRLRLRVRKTVPEWRQASCMITLATGNIRQFREPAQLLPWSHMRVGGSPLSIPQHAQHGGQITGIIAKGNVNIAHMVNRSWGDYAYTMVDVDQIISR